MDLSWCIICDRHCTDNNLYCSESCRFQDNNEFENCNDNRRKSIDTTPPTSPILTPFLYSFNRRPSTNSITIVSPSASSPTFKDYFTYSKSPSMSFYADDT